MAVVVVVVALPKFRATTMAVVAMTEPCSRETAITVEPVDVSWITGVKA